MCPLIGHATGTAHRLIVHRPPPVTYRGPGSPSKAPRGRDPDANPPREWAPPLRSWLSERAWAIVVWPILTVRPGSVTTDHRPCGRLHLDRTTAASCCSARRATSLGRARCAPVYSASGELVVGEAVDGGESLGKDPSAGPTVHTGSQVHQLLGDEPSAVEDAGEIEIVARFSPAEDGRHLRGYRVDLCEHRPHREPRWLVASHVSRQIDRAEATLPWVSDLEPSEGLPSADDGDLEAVAAVRLRHCVDRPAELVRVPPVGEEIDVFAHTLDQLVRLQRVSPGEDEAVPVEHLQPHSDEAALQLVHPWRRSQLGEALLPALAYTAR